VGESEVRAAFIIPAPGDPLPDMLALAVAALGLGDLFPEQIPEGLELISWEIEGKAEGELADGTSTKAETKQVSAIVDGNWIFFEEKIELEIE
jgi:hypothetical protein